jgi:hypothetical protein
MRFLELLLVQDILIRAQFHRTTKRVAAPVWHRRADLLDQTQERRFLECLHGDSVPADQAVFLGWRIPEQIAHDALHCKD